MNHPFPLLKLAAVAAAATAALLFFRRHQRLSSLHALHRNILDALLHLPGGVDGAAAPPTILVLGFRGHGKSAFVNTVCRALAGEEGPMVLRSETAPTGFPPATAERVVVRVAAAAGCGCGGWEKMEEEEVLVGEGLAVEFIDAPPLPELVTATPAQVEAALDAAAGGGAAAAAGNGDVGSGEALSMECVVMVLRCSRMAGERHLAFRRLTEIADVVRNRGLHLLIVLTHKRSLRNCKREELKLEVSFRARTNCIYFIDNYTAKCSTKCRTPTVVKNNFDTHCTALAITRQCIEFAAQHRRQSNRIPSSRRTINLITHIYESK